MVSSTFFETGSMAGLMTLLGRHSGIMTNFRIYYPESRLYLASGGPYAECEEPGVRRAQTGPGVPGGRRYTGLRHGLGPGNTNQPAGWVPGWVLPSPTHPGTVRTDDLSSCMHPATVAGTTGTCTYDQFRGRQGDPRGVKRT